MYRSGGGGGVGTYCLATRTGKEAQERLAVPAGSTAHHDCLHTALVGQTQQVEHLHPDENLVATDAHHLLAGLVVTEVWEQLS